MLELVRQPWFWPAVIVSVGLPLLLIGLTEFHNSIARRGSLGVRQNRNHGS